MANKLMTKKIITNKVDSSAQVGEQLTIFFDGMCPMCIAEMQHLKQQDSDNEIVLIDIHETADLALYPQIQFAAAMSVLHGIYEGKILKGLSVTHRAWTIVGKGLWVAPLEWPVIKPLSHQVYLLVAKYRHPISSFLSKVFGWKVSSCESDVCYRSESGEKVRNNHWR